MHIDPFHSCTVPIESSVLNVWCLNGCHLLLNPKNHLIRFNSIIMINIAELIRFTLCAQKPTSTTSEFG